MLKLFWRWGSAPVPPAAAPGNGRSRPRPRPADTPGTAYTATDPAPLPEVLAEGNEQTDWNLWEDSVHAIDSQMQGLVPSARIYGRGTRPNPLEELDPFGAIRKKRGP